MRTNTTMCNMLQFCSACFYLMKQVANLPEKKTLGIFELLYHVKTILIGVTSAIYFSCKYYDWVPVLLKERIYKQFEIHSIAKILIREINYIIVVLIVFCPTSSPIIGSGPFRSRLKFK